MSEWLGTGLQNRSQQFESAWHLCFLKALPNSGERFFYCIYLCNFTSVNYSCIQILFLETSLTASIFQKKLFKLIFY